MNTGSETRRFDPKTAVTVVVFLTFMLALACVPAGRWDLPWVWLFVASYTLSLVLIVLLVRDKGLLDERRHPGPGAKRWDEFLARVPAVFMGLILLFYGLGVRLGWPQWENSAVHLAGWAVVILSFVPTAWAMMANRFFSPVVRIQSERGHQVVDGGPYAIVRHPGYVGMILLNLGLPVMLGMPPLLILGALATVLMIVRTALEDRTLQAELPGYSDYTHRVKYRLLPDIW